MSEIDYFSMTKREMKGMAPHELELAGAIIMYYARGQIEEVQDILASKDIKDFLSEKYLSAERLQ